MYIDMSKRDRSEVDMELSSDELMAIVREIHTAPGTPRDKDVEFDKKYPGVKERYPVLFELACSRDFDMQRFEYMIRLRNQVLQGERTVEDTSVEVGQKMFDVYVGDKVKK